MLVIIHFYKIIQFWPPWWKIHFFGFENSTIGFPIPWLVKITLDTTQIRLKLQEIWLETQKGQNDPCQDQWSKWPVIVLLGRRCNIWQSINAIIEKLWVDEDMQDLGKVIKFHACWIPIVRVISILNTKRVKMTPAVLLVLMT